MGRSQKWLWSLYSRCYDGLLDFIPYRRLVDGAIDALEATSSHDAVDLGCGTGNGVSALLASAPGVRVVGVDSSEEMLRVARSKLGSEPGVQLVLADLLDWLRRADTDSADRLLSINVLYTMSAAQRAVFWRESMRVLRPSGRMVVVTTDRPGIGPVIREHTRERSFLRSITPRLAAVIVMNLVIWVFETSKVFDPASVDVLGDEIAEQGAVVVHQQRCYGGEVDGVDVLLVVEPTLDLRADENEQPSGAETDGSPHAHGAER